MLLLKGAEIDGLVEDMDMAGIMDIDMEKSKSLASRLDGKIQAGISVVNSGHALLEGSDVLITATTSMEPVIPGEADLISGKTFVGIGSFKPEMREFPDELYHLADQVFIDSRQATEESGDLVYALARGYFGRENIHTMGSLIKGTSTLSKNPTRFFKTVGMALFDLLAAEMIYQTAIEHKAGVEVDF